MADPYGGKSLAELLANGWRPEEVWSVWNADGSYSTYYPVRGGGYLTSEEQAALKSQGVKTADYKGHDDGYFSKYKNDALKETQYSHRTATGSIESAYQARDANGHPIDLYRTTEQDKAAKAAGAKPPAGGSPSPQASATPRPGATPSATATPGAQATATSTPAASGGGNKDAIAQANFGKSYAQLVSEGLKNAQAWVDEHSGSAPTTSATPQATSTPAAGAASASAGAAPDDQKTRLQELARNIAGIYGVPANSLLNLISHESGWDPKATNSTSGATGLGQLMPMNFAAYGVTADDLKTDPDHAIRIAASMLKDGYTRFADWDKAFAAYFIGGGNVEKAVAQGGADWKKIADQIASQYGPSTGNPGGGSQVSNYLAAINGGTGPGGTTTGGALQVTPPPAAPPPPPVAVGAIPNQALSPEIQTRFGAGKVAVPIFSGEGSDGTARFQVTTALKTPTTSVYAPNEHIGVGYNPYALAASSPGFNDFGIPQFGSVTRDQMAQFQVNPYSADNPMEQGALAGAQVKPVSFITDAYGRITVDNPQDITGAGANQWNQPGLVTSHASGARLRIMRPATVIDNATGRPIATLGEVRPEGLRDDGRGHIMIDNSLPGTARYDGTRTDAGPSRPFYGGGRFVIRHYDDGGAVLGSLTGDDTSKPIPTANATADETQPAASTAGIQVIPAPQTTAPVATAPAGPVAQTVNVGGKTYTIPPAPTPPSATSANASSGIADPTWDPFGRFNQGQPPKTLTNAEAYDQQYRDWLKQLTDIEGGTAQQGLDALNKLNNTPQSERDAISRTQHDRDVTAYKYPAAGLPQPTLEQPTMGTSGLGQVSSTPGVRIALLNPEEQYSRMSGNLGAATAELGRMVSVARQRADLDRQSFLAAIAPPPGPSLATQIASAITKASGNGLAPASAGFKGRT